MPRAASAVGWHRRRMMFLAEGTGQGDQSIYRFLLFLVDRVCVCAFMCVQMHMRIGAHSCVCMHVEVRGQRWMSVLRYLPFLTFLKNIVSLTCLELAALDNAGWPEIPRDLTCPPFQPWHQKTVTVCLCPAFYLFILKYGFLGSNWHLLLAGQSP